MRSKSSMGILGFFAIMFASLKGMGTNDCAPAHIRTPYRRFEGYTVIGTRSNGPAPIPGVHLNQRQKRRDARRSGSFK